MVPRKPSRALKPWILFTILMIIPSTIVGCRQAEFSPGWFYPRFDIANTAANDRESCHLLKQPQEQWQIRLPIGDIPYALFPVAADMDKDGTLEYLLSGWNWEQQGIWWLAAFNLEDGSLLWKTTYPEMLLWSAPVIVDLDKDGWQEIVLAAGNQIMALQGANGATIWQQSLYADGMGMVVADIIKGGQPEIFITDYGDPQRAYLIDSSDGSAIWTREIKGSAYNLPAVADINDDGHLEILSHAHRYNPSREELLVWDREGNQVWTYAASPAPSQQDNAPAELGWVPDYGNISTSVADFNADGVLEIGWGTRCHYYLLDRQGNLLWRTLIVEGFGILRVHHTDGTIEPDLHGTGGPHGYAAAVGNLDSDPALEVVLGFEPEYIADFYEETDIMVYERISPANLLRAYNGEDGSLLWVFEGEYPSDDRTEMMYEPLLVDLTGDRLLDVLSLSSDRHLYAVQGFDGQQLLAHTLGAEADELFWVSHHLTFVVDKGAGIVLYTTGTDSTSPPTAYLHALQIAEDCQ